MSRPGGLNLHLYPTPFTHESRILKQTATLAASGLFDRVEVGATWREGLPEREAIDASRQVWRVRLAAGGLPTPAGKVVRFVEWETRLIARYRSEPVRCISAHSLSALPAAVVLKKLTGAKLVYDTHELETETEMSGLRKRGSKLLERRLMPYVDAIFAVSHSIADWYERAYRIETTLVRNIPARRPAEIRRGSALRARLGLSPDAIIFLYQGTLEHGRGIEVLLDAFAGVDGGRHLVMLGFGDLAAKVQEYGQRYRNIHFVPGVKPEELLDLTAGADVGVHLIEHTCLNHYYCLPNKIFEYLFAGLPAIVSDFPEMGRLVDESGFGWRVNPDAGSLRALLERLTPADIDARRARAEENRLRYSWDAEAARMMERYARLFGGAPQPG